MIILPLGSREALAAERGKLISALTHNGIALLNADDRVTTGLALHIPRQAPIPQSQQERIGSEPE